MKYIARVIGFVSFLGFGASLAAHVLSCVGVDLRTQFPKVWLLPLGAVSVLAPYLYMRRRTRGIYNNDLAAKLCYPYWASIARDVITIYALANFLIFLFLTNGLVSSEKGGKFVLENHGRFVREISLREYTKYRANEFRGLSGWLLVCYFTPFVYFSFVRSDRGFSYGRA